MEEGGIECAIRATDPELARVPISIRVNVGGGRIAHLDAPMAVATRLAVIGKIKIGWSFCRVKLIESKIRRCYRCQERGHTKHECKAEAVVKKCYRCAKVGHLISDCTRNTDNGQTATNPVGEHRVGQGPVPGSTTQ